MGIKIENESILNKTLHTTYTDISAHTRHNKDAAADLIKNTATYPD